MQHARVTLVLANSDYERLCIKAHVKTCHQGAIYLHTIMSQKYWTNGAYAVAQNTLRRCHQCAIYFSHRKRIQSSRYCASLDVTSWAIDLKVLGNKKTNTLRYVLVSINLHILSCSHT